MKREKLSEQTLQEKIKQLPNGWKLDGNTLKKEFKFPDFIKAFSFLTEVAIHSQVLDHHPKILNVYNKVELELWTHDVGGLTELDFELAKRIG